MNERQIKEAAIRETAAAFGLTKVADLVDTLGGRRQAATLAATTLLGLGLHGAGYYRGRKQEPDSVEAAKAQLDEPYNINLGLTPTWKGNYGHHLGQRQAAKNYLAAHES